MSLQFNATPRPSFTPGVTTGERPSGAFSNLGAFSQPGVFPDPGRAGGAHGHQYYITSRAYDWGQPLAPDQTLYMQYVFQRGRPPRRRGEGKSLYHNIAQMWSGLTTQTVGDQWTANDQIGRYACQIFTPPALNYLLRHEQKQPDGGPVFEEIMESLNMTPYGVVWVANQEVQDPWGNPADRKMSSVLSVVVDGEVDMSYMFQIPSHHTSRTLQGVDLFLCAARKSRDDWKQKGFDRYRLGATQPMKPAPTDPKYTDHPYQVWFQAGERPTLGDLQGVDDAGLYARAYVQRIGNVIDWSSRPEVPNTASLVTDNSMAAHCGVATIQLSRSGITPW